MAMAMAMAMSGGSRSLLSAKPALSAFLGRPFHGKALPSIRTLRKPLLPCPVRAATGGGGEGTPKQSQYGLGGQGTWFGFGKNQERQVGRLAMLGFMAGVTMEVLTGKGVLGQLGIDAVAVRYPFLAGFSFLLIAGLLGGYVVINNPPDPSKAPLNEGSGLPRNPLKTFDAKTLDPQTTYTRGGIVSRPSGEKGREPYVSDLDLPPPPKKNE